MNWKEKSTEKIYKYFGYDFQKKYDNSEDKAKDRQTALDSMKKFGVDQEVIDRASKQNDEMIAKEKRDREFKERERQRQLEIRRTKATNKENKVYEDDPHAQAVYLHLIENEGVEEIDIYVDEINELGPKIKKLKNKLERLTDINDDGKYDDKIEYVELKIDTLEAQYDEAEEMVDEYGIYAILYESQWEHYGLRHFDCDSYGEYAVGTDEEADDAAKESLTNQLDELGIEGISSWVIEDNINDSRLKEDLVASYLEHYRDDITYDLSDYFEDYDEDDEETHPSDDDIEEKAEEMANDRAEDLMSDYANLEYEGWDVKDYVDMDGVADDILRHDGRGNTLSHYDGNEEYQDIDGVSYYVYRTN
jgi:hypothetical protein